MTERFERFSLSITEISRYWHKIAGDEMEKYGLKGPHCIYLIVMLRYPEGLTAVRLGELCGRDKADVSRMMSIMEKKGLILRDEKQYRGLLKLTEAGIAAAQSVESRACVAVEAAGRGLSDEKREIFYEALSHIAGNLREISRDGLPEEKGE